MCPILLLSRINLCFLFTCSLPTAETEGYDLIGQITPYTYSGALELIPKLAAQLLTRLQSLQPAGANPRSADAGIEAARSEVQTLLSVELPQLLFKYSQQFQSATAGVQQDQQLNTSFSRDADNIDGAFRDLDELLGFGGDTQLWLANASTLGDAAAAPDPEEGNSRPRRSVAGAAVDCDIEYLTDADIAQAAAATSSLAPDLHKEVAQQQQEGDGDDLPAWMVDGGLEGWDYGEVDAAATADLHAPQNSWFAELSNNAEGTHTSSGEAANQAGLDALDILFGGGYGQGEDGSTAAAYPAVAAPGAADGAGSSAATQTGEVASVAREGSGAADSSGLWLVQAGVEQGMQPSQEQGGGEWMVEGLTALEEDEAKGVGGAAAKSLPSSPSAAEDTASSTSEQAASIGDFINDYLSGLPLKERSELLLQAQADIGGSATATSTEPTVTLPKQLQQAVQRTIELLTALVAAPEHGQNRNTADAASQQLLEKIIKLWQQLCSPATKTSDPLFIFRDGPVTRAAKQGQLLLLEDFDSPSQAVTERLNSLLEPEPSFLVAEDITVGAAGSGVELPPGFQVSKLLVFSRFLHSRLVCSSPAAMCGYENSFCVCAQACSTLWVTV